LHFAVTVQKNVFVACWANSPIAAQGDFY